MLIDALKKKKTFAFFAAGWTDATANGIEKVNGRAVKNASIFNSNRLEKIGLRQHWIFADLIIIIIIIIRVAIDGNTQ